MSPADYETFLDFVAVILITLPLIDITAAAVLWIGVHRARSEGYLPRSLYRAATAATLVAGSTLIGGFLGLNRIFTLHVDPVTTITLLVVAMALPSMANVAWLIDYSRGRFGKR